MTEDAILEISPQDLVGYLITLHKAA